VAIDIGESVQSHQDQQKAWEDRALTRANSKKHKIMRGPKKGHCRGRSNQKAVSYVSLAETFLSFSV